MGMGMGMGMVQKKKKDVAKLLRVAVLLLLVLGPSSIVRGQEEEEEGGGLGDMDGLPPGMMNMDGMDLSSLMGGGEGGMDLSSMMGGVGGGGGGNQMGYAQREEIFKDQTPLDTPFVLCDVCKVLTRKVYTMVKDRKEKLPNTKLSEFEINDMLKDLCKPRSEAGKWLNEYQVEESENLHENPKITIKRMPGVGFCEESCWLMENACNQIQETVDSDLVEELWRFKLSKDDLVTKVCEKMIEDLPGACGKPYPKMPKDRQDQKRKYSFRKKSEMDLMFDKANLKMNTEL